MENYQKIDFHKKNSEEKIFENEARICNFDSDFKLTDNLVGSINAGILFKEKEKENLPPYRRLPTV